MRGMEANAAGSGSDPRLRVLEGIVSRLTDTKMTSQKKEMTGNEQYKATKAKRCVCTYAQV